MGFGEEISQVVSTRLPLEVEMAHSNTITDPMIAEGNGFGSTLFAGAKGKFSADGVVIGNNSRFLGIAKVMKSLAQFFALLGIEEQGSVLSFCSRSTDSRDLFTQEVDGPIEFGGWVIRIAVIVDGPKGEESSSTRPGTRFGIKRGIGVNGQLHIRGSIGNPGMGMTSSILKETLNFKHGALSGIGLLLGQFFDGVEVCAVNGHGVVEELAYNPLKVMPLCRRSRG